MKFVQTSHALVSHGAEVAKQTIPQVSGQNPLTFFPELSGFLTSLTLEFLRSDYFIYAPACVGHHISTELPVICLRWILRPTSGGLNCAPVGVT